MSFILDALKKAEAERNRHIAPVLMDARAAPPRRSLPAWAWVLGAVLLVNLAVLGWLLLRTPAPGMVQLPAAAAGEGTGAEPAAVSTTATAPAPAGPGSGSAPAAEPPFPTITPPAGPAAPGTASPSSAPGAAQPTDFDRLPSLRDLRAAGINLPELQLNLHVYDPAPAYRSVLLNGQRLREGEYAPDGVKVEFITPVGVVLEAAGRRFRLDVGD